VRAEVQALSNLLAHADYAEIMGWLDDFETPPRQTFVTHGEPIAADALRHHIEETRHWRCLAPDYLQTVNLK
jgi:metallo-beta-lactamase family protein